MRVAHVDRRGPGGRRTPGAGRARAGPAPCRRGPSPTPAPRPARTSTVRTPPAVATVKRGGDDQAGVHRRLGQAADAVAAHLGLAAVGVVQLHGQVAAVAARPDPDDPVGPDAPAPVGQQAHLGHREPDGVVGVEHDQEVVARALVLGGVHDSILAGWTSLSRARRGPAPAAPGPRPRSSAQAMRGSRRNHEAWRRANWRVRRTASSRQSSAGAPSSTWARISR